VQGRLVDWNFESLEDVLEMSPESTVMAYWINLSAPHNMIDSARDVLPTSLGLTYTDQLYSTPIESWGKRISTTPGLSSTGSSLSP